jgi:hypothetical protein
MKLTKRLGFHFMRSYFDLLNEIPDKEDKLNFLLSIINKQFLDENPTELNFVVKLSYESQRHAIEKSVKGWKLATKTDLKGNPLSTPPSDPKGSIPSDPKEVQVQEKEKEKYIYTEKEFLNSWKIAREGYLNKPTNIPKLSTMERLDFNNSLKDFSKEQIKTAIHGLFKQKNITIQSMTLMPKHFLENISKYYNAEMSKNYELYGAKVVKTQL